MNVLEVQQGENVITFEFNELHDLMEFAECCIECGGDTTTVIIYPKKEEN